jgi:hypothetical protein
VNPGTICAREWGASPSRFEALLAKVKFQDWAFIVGQDDDRAYLQVRFLAADNCSDGAELVPQSGRKWFLSPHMTDSEVIGTAFKAVMTAVEHETREQFTYRGAAIYGPHFNVDELVHLTKYGTTDGRA